MPHNWNMSIASIPTLGVPANADEATVDPGLDTCPVYISHRHDIDWYGEYGRCTGCGALRHRTLELPKGNPGRCPYCGVPVSTGGLCSDCAYDVSREGSDLRTIW